MRSHIATFTIAAMTVGGATWIAGCDSLPFPGSAGSTPSEFLSVGTGKLGDMESLPVESDAVRSASASVALPDDLVADASDEAVMVLSASDISVAVDADPAGQPAPIARHATLTFGLARWGDDACASEHRVGPFELTIEGGLVTVADESLALDAGARSVVRGGRFELCSEVWADFSGSISVGNVSFEFGRLRSGEERVTLCHFPPGDPDAAHTITVGSSAVDAHLAHGDYPGECAPNDGDVDEGGDDDGDNADDADGGDDGDSGDESADDDGEENDVDEGDGDDANTEDDNGDGAEPDVDDPTDSEPSDIILVEVAVCDDTTRHCYAFVDDPLWWDDALVRAELMVYDGVTGHLATVTSDHENSFLKENFGRPGMLGGTDADTEGVWVWADGPEAGQEIDYLPWADGEPNNLMHWTYPTGEHYLQLEVRGFNDINGERGFYVEFEPNDSDTDGVLDADDECPDTPSAEAVDSAGCSCSQKDADSDGVNDCDDACPGTGSGLSVDAVGCAANQLDDDNDGVTNDVDACPGTPHGDDVGADGCTLVTIEADAGSNIATMVGVSIDLVGTATVLTGDYPESSLVYLWEQVTGGAVAFQADGPSLNVDTAGATGDVVVRLTASTADGSASDTDELTIALDTDAITVDSASCDSASGHCYILARKSDGSNDQLWWDDAKAKANRMVYDGMRGHLPTITSAEERQFLAGVASNTPAMLGGTDSDEEGVWVWADGPESGQLIEYLPWAESEPNNLYHWTYPEGEDYLQHEGRGHNDINGARWYYVEFEAGWY